MVMLLQLKVGGTVQPVMMNQSQSCGEGKGQKMLNVMIVITHTALLFLVLPQAIKHREEILTAVF